MADFRDLLDGTTLSYSSGRAHLHPDVVEKYDEPYAATRETFYVKGARFGGVCDGVTDDTQAVLDAVEAAEVNGGVVRFPSGVTRVREEVVVQFSNPGAHKPVFFCGDGEQVSRLYFDNSDLDDNGIVFYTPGDEYFGGGVRDMSIFGNGSNRGAGIYNRDGYRQKIENVWVREWSGVGGTGLKVDSPNGGGAQHLRLANVHLQVCTVGMDIDGSREMSAIELNLNQCGIPGIIRDQVQLLWLGGMVQGGTFEFRTLGQNGIEFTQIGTYHESAVSPQYKGYSASGGGFAGQVRILNAHNGGGGTFADFDHFNLTLGPIVGGNAGVLVLKARNCTLQMVDLYMQGFEDRYDIDAASLRTSTWINQGNISIGTGGGVPDYGAPALSLGGPLRLPTYTTTTRNTLTPETGWVIFNSTTGTLQTYNGSTWV